MLLNPFEKFLFAKDEDAAAAVADPPESESESTDEQVIEPGDGADSAESAPEPITLSEIYKAAGIDGLPDDPKALHEEYRRLKAQSEQAEQYRTQALWLNHNYQQLLAAQGQKPVEPEKPKKPWDIPEFDRRAIEFLQRNPETGELEVKPGGDPSLLQKYQAWTRAREDAMDRMLNDPYGTLGEGLAPLIQKQAAQMAQAVVEQYGERTYLAEQEQKSRWLFGDNGQLNQDGQLWNQYYAMFRNNGMPYYQAGALAYKSINGEYLESAMREQPAQTNDEKKKALLRNGTRKPNRGGTFPSRTRTSPPQNNRDIWASARAELDALPTEDFEIN